MKKEEDKKNTATELLPGGIVEAGTAINFHTGDWRLKKPIWNKNKCINCFLCWISCPDGSIKIVQDKNGISHVDGIDYFSCKGCGICAEECPITVNAIIMEQERK
ncbi:MAG: 4Fe-4S dicluster domain-containing protein [Endomicrobium sp.]|nr:4Fe-4S dicluster domain-containing protein [Endomicrobium sp.]